MMGATHHAAGALFAAAGTGAVGHAVGLDFSAPEIAAATVIGLVAGVLPDIDHHSSNITKGRIPMFRYLGRHLGPIVAQLFSIPPRIVGVGVRATGNHRGPTHSMTFLALWAIIAAPLYAAVFAGLAFALNFVLGALSGAILQPIFGFSLAIPVSEYVSWLLDNVPRAMPLVMIAVALGYLSHLVCDGMTKVPIPLLWPMRKRFFLLPKPLRVQTDSSLEVHLIRPIVIVLALFFFVLNAAYPMGSQAFDRGKQEAQKIEQQIQKRKPKAPRIDR
jgi:membrane-bound metal-dependent hydrolase YbcI (DUF457 family)